MISCPDADLIAAALAVGSSDSTENAALDVHVAGCADCRRLAGEYLEAAARLPLSLEPLSPPPDLRGRLMRAVYEEAALARAQAAAAKPASLWRRLWAATPSGRGFTLAAAVAAAAVIALSSWIAVDHIGASPASVSVALVSTAAAPDAQGELVYVPSAGQASLTVTGLPTAALAGGSRVYEVWLIRPNGTVVGAAFLAQGPDGTWSAAVRGNIAAYSAVAATVEPRGGSRGPTTAPVFEGSLDAT
jgi:anti-sigma-K factor RskA